MSKKAVLDDPFNTPAPAKNWTPLIILVVILAVLPMVLVVGFVMVGFLVYKNVIVSTTYEVDRFLETVTYDMPAAYQMLDYGLKDYISEDGFAEVMGEFVGCGFVGQTTEFGSVGIEDTDGYDDLKINNGWLDCGGTTFDEVRFEFRMKEEGAFRFVDMTIDWAGGIDGSYDGHRDVVYEMMVASGSFDPDAAMPRGGELGYGFIDIDSRWMELRNIPGTIRWLASAEGVTISLSRGDMYAGRAAFEVASGAAQSMAGEDWNVTGPDATLVGVYDGHLVVGDYLGWRRVYSYFVDDGRDGVIVLTFEVSGNWGWDEGGEYRDSIEAIVESFRLEG